METILNWLDQFFKGKVTLGNTNAPATGMQLTVAGDVGPEASGTRNIGATALRWAASWFTGNLSVGVASTGDGALIHTTANAQADQNIGELASGTGGNSVFRRSRRTRGTLGSHTTVSTFDFIRTDSSEADAGAGYLPVVQEITYVASRAATNDVGGTWALHTRPDGASAVLTARIEINYRGSVVLGDQTTTLATTVTDGFLYIRNCAGVPTGAATAFTGAVPIIIDTTNLRIYIRIAGTWRFAQLT